VQVAVLDPSAPYAAAVRAGWRTRGSPSITSTWSSGRIPATIIQEYEVSH
jgi:hypothetical protein